MLSLSAARRSCEPIDFYFKMPRHWLDVGLYATGNEHEPERSDPRLMRAPD